MIPPDVQAKLDRLEQLYRQIKAGRENEWNDHVEEVFAAYRQLQSEIVTLFLPVVQQLVRCGSLSLAIEVEKIHEAFDEQQYTELHFDVEWAFENGNIWLEAGGHIGGRLGTPPD